MTGPAAVTADSVTTVSGLALTAVVIVAIILLLVYRSPVLWLLPLAGSIGAIVVAEAAAHGLAAVGFTVTPLTSSILIVLVFGAASDYALLLIHRYREELRHGPAEDAMAAALRATLPTLVASAATVTGAMFCLLAAQSASLHGLGPLGAVAIVSALLAQATFLPALLLVAGRCAFWPRISRPGETRTEESRLWSGIGRRIAGHPRPVAAVGLLLLALGCLGLLTAQTTNNPFSDIKGRPGSVVGAQLLAAHYPAGTIAPLDLLAEPGHAAAAAAIAQATPGVASVTAGPTVAGYDSFLVTLSVPPYGPQAATAIAGMRQRLTRAAPGSLVGGDPAIEYDIGRAAARDTILLVPLVLLVILVVITVLLRAVAAPLVLVATTGLSFAASFGLSNLLWKYGLGYPGFIAQLPLYIFIFIVALGVDYNIFLSARVREEARRVGTCQGTLRGLSVTGGVITAAGVVVAATFAALAQLPSVSITEVGTAVALGVLLDTFFVRTIVVPALLLTAGDRIWWPSAQASAAARRRPRRFPTRCSP